MRTCSGSPSLPGNTPPIAVPPFLQKAIPLLYTTGKEKILAERIENMEYRALGRTGWKISAIGFGAWGIGGNDWGPTDDKTSLAALNQAIDLVKRCQGCLVIRWPPIISTNTPCSKADS